jgi:Z1 domain-containing protein/type III restriction/modification enzyme restriction subunit
MTNDIKQFKITVINLLPKNDEEVKLSEDTINKVIENVFKASTLLKINVTEEEKETVRKEILSENKVLLGLGAAIVQRHHKKWFAQRKDQLELAYWDRFKQFLLMYQSLPSNVVNQMDNVSDEIVDLLGDPTRDDEKEQRRGLIIGDVQSGKTLNYSGIICKAVDSGFRTVILLTGTTNDLRQQTQVRIDEAFVGVDSNLIGNDANSIEPIGVGLINPEQKLRPIVFTTAAKDFNKNTAKQLSMTLSQGQGDRPMLFVIKKNVSILNSLLEWIQKHNQYETNKINNSVLMIDDEADYASVNTKAADEDPSRTNKLIEDLLNIFRFASYVGFTATPYANVFIDPDTDEDMENEGLFPKDYIYALDAPTNYIGARNIFPKDAEYHYILRDIKDGEDYYPLRHKKDDDFGTLSPSLKDAINTFLVANVIRDLRGDKHKHRSMMINISRFVNTQKMLHKAIEEYLSEIKTSIKNYAALSAEKALKDENINALFVAFENEYGSNEFSWEQVQKSLFESVLPIQPKVAHGGGDDLDYNNYQGGLRTIVVGGQRLSRGLTLEGLIVSYIYRNSMAYDTLMQMGRWFGYRNNYDDICRVWIDSVSQAWYAFICEATDELLSEVRVMRDKGATPLDFGLKVRNDPEIPLIVTARNKMRTAENKVINVALSQKAIETPIIYNDASKNMRNLSTVEKLLKDIELESFGKQYGARDVDKKHILELLQNIDVPAANIKFDPQAIVKFINQYAGNELEAWDVVLLSGNEPAYGITDKVALHTRERDFDVIRNGELVRMSKARSRIGSPSDPQFGLTDIQMEALKSRGEYLTSDSYFRINRKPLLMIYLVSPKIESIDFDKLTDFQGYPLVGFGIGIPSLTDTKTKYIGYQVNRIHQEYGGVEDYSDE